MQKILQKIKDCPEIRTAIFFFSVILSGILSSSFVTEISQNGKLNWGDFYKQSSFWGILIYTFIIYFYNRFLYRHEKNIMKFLDEDYCKAYIVEACLPNIIIKYKQDLKSGKKSTEVIDISEELKKLKK